MSSSLIHLKDKAIRLREQGFSYGHIKRELNLKSKGTLSIWLRNIKLSEQSKLLLSKNNELAIRRGLFNFNSKRTESINEENNLAHTEGTKLIPDRLSKIDLLIIGTALYWGEGTKSWGENSYSRFSFANSDPKMIAVCMRFLREILNIQESRIMCGIHLYNDTNISKARKFWSKITGLQPNRFYVTKQVTRASGGVRKAILPHGTFHIKVNSRLVFYKVKGMIDGLIANLGV